MRTVDQLLELGHKARAASRLEEARANFGEALAMTQRDQETSHQIAPLKGLGQVARDVGDLELARAYYESAATICESTGDARRLAHIIRHVGDIYFEQGQLSLASKNCQRALAIYRSSSDDATDLDLANALRSVALIEESISGLERSRPLWEEAKEIYAALGISAGVDECDAHLRHSRV